MRGALLCSSVLLARGAPAAGGEWDSGADLVVEGGIGRSAGRSAGRSLCGLALTRLAWQQAKSDADGGVRSRAYASALSLQGKGPAERFLGDALGSSNIEGSNGARLYSAWFETGTGAWSVRAGALLADEEFAGTTAGGNLVNSSFGWPAFISANTVNTGPAFYVAALGVRLERRWNETTAGRLGVYDGDTFDSATGDPLVNRHGWRHRLDGSQGWFVMGEVSSAWREGTLRGKTGAWLHTAEFADLRFDAAGRPIAETGAPPRVHGGNGGLYAALEQTLRGEPGKPGNLEVFWRGGAAPADRSRLAWSIDCGLAWVGLVPARPADVLTFGATHAAFSSELAAEARATDPMTPAPDFERVLEINYRFVLSERYTFSPDLQYVRHPGGSAARRDALAVLLRFNASL